MPSFCATLCRTYDQLHGSAKLTRLRKEVAKVRMLRDIREQATAYLLMGCGFSSEITCINLDQSCKPWRHMSDDHFNAQTQSLSNVDYVRAMVKRLTTPAPSFTLVLTSHSPVQHVVTLRQ